MEEHDNESMPPIEKIADMTLIAKLAVFFQEERERKDVSAALLTIAAASLTEKDMAALMVVMKQFAIDHGCKGELQKVEVGKKKESEPIMPAPTIKLDPSDYGPEECQRN